MTAADADRADLLQGTLDLLILKVLGPGPLHGYGICQRIEQASRDVLRIRQGSLYPALYRLERQGAVAAAWGVTDTHREAKFYRLTALGKKRLAAETESWRRLTAAVARVLAAGGARG
jgi:transcriptional regulator